MGGEILCPKCHKRNDIHKFCVYCGHELLDDDKLRLMLDNPDPYCLNCGRPVKKGQGKCECGFEFGDINCPICRTKNAYTNRFCIICGKKLWTSNVCEINYGEIKPGFIGDGFPQELHNSILHLRYKKKLKINFPDDIKKINGSIENLYLDKTNVDNHLSEIISRWKIISPNYCINCMSIIKPDAYRCGKCRTLLLYDEKRVDEVKNKYVKPVFDILELKWNTKFSTHYLDSLAPDIGESQFDYRERLKWEFVENNNLKKSINNAIKQEKEKKRQREERERFLKEREERRRWEEEYIMKFGGGYCSLSCNYCYEEFLDSGGGIVGYFDSGGYVEYYCNLGHSVHFGSFCKDYK